MTKTAAKSAPTKSIHKISFSKALYPYQHPTGDLASSATFARVLSPPVDLSPVGVLGLNHFNITASPALVEQLKRFYVDIIGLTVGPRTQLDHEGYWLYAGDLSVLHLSARQRPTCQPAEQTGGCFNHISLSCVGLADTVKRMIATKTPYKISIIPDLSQIQIFLKDPAGLGVELTFFNESLPEVVRTRC